MGSIPTIGYFHTVGPKTKQYLPVWPSTLKIRYLHTFIPFLCYTNQDRAILTNLWCSAIMFRLSTTENESSQHGALELVTVRLTTIASRGGREIFCSPSFTFSPAPNSSNFLTLRKKYQEKAKDDISTAVPTNFLYRERSQDFVKLASSVHPNIAAATRKKWICKIPPVW